MCIRLKKNCKDARETSLIGQGFQAYIGHLFWYLPFSNPKQSHDMLAKEEMSDEPWTIKRDEITCWSELLQLLEWGGKLRLQSTVWKGGC
jgi:hypothetical protein